MGSSQSKAARRPPVSRPLTTRPPTVRPPTVRPPTTRPRPTRPAPPWPKKINAYMAASGESINISDIMVQHMNATQCWKCKDPVYYRKGEDVVIHNVPGCCLTMHTGCALRHIRERFSDRRGAQSSRVMCPKCSGWMNMRATLAGKKAPLGFVTF